MWEDRTGLRLLAEIGDIRRFHSSKALVAYAGIDVSPYQFGQFEAREQKITKRGSKYLRKVLYEIVQSLKTVKPTKDNAVYQYILRKELEGKVSKKAKVTGMNKFLRIYYARVMEVYQLWINRAPWCLKKNHNVKKPYLRTVIFVGGDIHVKKYIFYKFLS